ncbi:MAG: small ribosomal subunit Rsm22 family protein [Phenylobacterium sp.]
MDPALPAALRAAVDLALEGRALGSGAPGGLTQRAGSISEGYRRGRASSALVKDEADALAYALTRMPATYAATRRALQEILALRPRFSPATLLDAGAGPGGAAWAALDALPSLSAVARLDHSLAFLDLAERLAAHGPRALAGADRLLADLSAPDFKAPEADLVVAAYALTEIAPERRVGAALRLLAATRDLLLIVEPGSTEAWRRGVEIRSALIDAGAHLVGPCPHPAPCPLQAPDWCHFAQRLPRSRAHRLTKAGTAPFEDEKFFWLAFARAPTDLRERAGARVIAPTRLGKTGVRLRLCQADGAVTELQIPRREREAFHRARRLEWGSAFDPGTRPDLAR